MKPFTIAIDINCPRDRVIEIFDNPDNMAKWQEGFQSFEPLSGTPGQPGAKSKLIYINGKHRIQLIETITVRDLPDEFNGTYEWDGGSNTLRNQFTQVSPSATRWTSTCTYEFKGPMLKLMGLFVPGMFKKQNMKFMQNFKALCEDGSDIRDQ